MGAYVHTHLEVSIISVGRANIAGGGGGRPYVLR